MLSVAIGLVCRFSIIESNVNNAGRGANVVVFDVDSMQVVKAVRFDTYQSSDGLLFVCLSVSLFVLLYLALNNCAY